MQPTSTYNTHTQPTRIADAYSVRHTAPIDPPHNHPPASKQLEYSDECSRTFVFGDEDHTLGNSLRHVLMGR